MRGRTIVVPMKGNTRKNFIEKWLEKNCQASAGPYPCISGMRNLYWGKEALIVKAGAYIYLMTTKDEGRELPL